MSTNSFEAVEGCFVIRMWPIIYSCRNCSLKISTNIASNLSKTNLTSKSKKLTIRSSNQSSAGSRISSTQKNLWTMICFITRISRRSWLTPLAGKKNTSNRSWELPRCRTPTRTWTRPQNSSRSKILLIPLRSSSQVLGIYCSPVYWTRKFTNFCITLSAGLIRPREW